MNEYQKQKKDNYIKKLVSNSRAILTNQIALPLGVHKMNKIVYWINNIEPIIDIDLSIFDEYDSKTRVFALGTDRLTYNREFLKMQDQELDEITSIYKNDLLDKYFEIINHYKQIGL